MMAGGQGEAHRRADKGAGSVQSHVLVCALRVTAALLFPAVHPLDVVLVACFQLLALELEGVRHQSRLGSPGIWAQADLARDLEALELA